MPDRKIYKHIIGSGGWSKWEIILLEKCPDVKDDEELRMKEEAHRSKYHGDPLLLNSKKAFGGVRRGDCENDSHYKKLVKHQYYQENRDVHLLKCKQRNTENAEAVKEQKRIYRLNHLPEELSRRRRYAELHKDDIARKQKQYREEHRDTLSEKKKQYRVENLERLREVRTNPYVCPVCDESVQWNNKTRHERTQKHKLNLQEVKSI